MLTCLIYSVCILLFVHQIKSIKNDNQSKMTISLSNNYNLSNIIYHLFYLYKLFLTSGSVHLLYCGLYGGPNIGSLTNHRLKMNISTSRVSAIPRRNEHKMIVNIVRLFIYNLTIPTQPTVNTSDFQGKILTTSVRKIRKLWRKIGNHFVT